MFDERPSVEKLSAAIRITLCDILDMLEAGKNQVAVENAQKLFSLAQKLESKIWFDNKQGGSGLDD